MIAFLCSGIDVAPAWHIGSVKIGYQSKPEQDPSVNVLESL